MTTLKHIAYQLTFSVEDRQSWACWLLAAFFGAGAYSAYGRQDWGGFAANCTLVGMNLGMWIKNGRAGKQ